MIPTREQAWDLLCEYNEGEFHRLHARIVGDVMRYFAVELGYDDEADFWQTVGILHDLDFEQYPDQHCTKEAEILREKGYTSTCIGFEGNASGRGYDKYLGFAGWGPDHDDGRAHKAQNLNDVAIPELERLAKQDQPFFLFMRHMDPHSPYLAPKPFQDIFFQGDAFDPNDKRMQKVYDFKPFGDYIGSWVPKGCTNPDYVIAQYDAAVAYMDACIQQILEKLAALGLEEDTIVIFTSDHGEMLGDHCMLRKSQPYEGSAHVPLLLWDPGGHLGLPRGGRCTALAELRDVMPTLLAIAGVPIPGCVDGKPLLDAARAGVPVRQSLHGEHTAQSGPPHSAHYLLEGEYKYIWYSHTGREQLFNLAADPRELRDLAGEAACAQTLARLRGLLARELEGREEGYSDGTRLIAGRPPVTVLRHPKL